MNLLFILLLLKIVKEYRQGTSFLPKVSNNGTACPHCLLHLTVSIELGQPTPSTELFSTIDHDDRDFAFGTEGTNELLVLLVFAILGKTAKTGRTTIEGLGTLV